MLSERGLNPQGIAAWPAIAALGMTLFASSLPAQAGGSKSGSTAQAQNGQLQAQDSPAQLPKFDVASIKPHKSEGMFMRMGLRLTPDGVSIEGVPLALLLRSTFGLPDDRILNEPAWTKSARYDIQAKVDPDDAPKLEKLTMDERMAMLVPLLEDRFGLKFHHETKEMEVYDLVVAKGGAKLQPAKPASAGEDTGADGREGAQAGRATMGGKPPQGTTMRRFSPQGITLQARAVTMTELARVIAEELRSTVVDKSGLTGNYDYTLTFAPEMGAGPLADMPPGAPSPGGGDAQPPSGPSIFSALQEQLGLKLEAHKEPVDVIVIDHIEQPSPN